MKLLLDTHAFLFAIAQPRSLSARLRRLLIDPGVERWVSVVSLWEIAVKVQAGKLVMPAEPGYYHTHLEALGARTLAVSLRHSLTMFALPLHHRDPFDRLIVAQAVDEGLTLASRDSAFAAYGVECLWA